MNIAVLVSGGVDSSVALRLLHEQGHALTAYYIKIWLEDELSYLGSCPWEEDLKYVRAVCAQIGVPLEVVALQREYAQEVLAYTLQEVRLGYTPSPDIMCNERIKFGAFRRVVSDSHAMIATGHYARIIHEGIESYLLRSPDVIKDQTYFLARLSHEQLSCALFPIGNLKKIEVRELAQRYNLPNCNRPDSQGICFLGKISFAEFLEHHLGTQEGPLVDYETGVPVGKHRGFWFYTSGQRQGIGLSGGPWYVVQKDIEKNIVYISRDYETLKHERMNFWVRDVCWLVPEVAHRILQAGTAVSMKLRHGPQLHEGTVHVCPDRPGWLEIKLIKPDQGIAPGQFVVFYDGDRCVGSGVITRKDMVL
jgi:tRNA (5-methylaminomethyl-2-thiouridylate)-methyltransferase